MQGLGYFFIGKQLFNFRDGVLFNGEVLVFVKMLFLHFFAACGQVAYGMVIGG